MKKQLITTVAALFAAFQLNVSAGTTATPTQTPAPASPVYGSLNLGVGSNHTYRGQVLDTNPAFEGVLSLHVPVSEGVSLFGQTEQVIASKGTGLFWSKYKGGVNLTSGRWTFGPGYEAITNKVKDLTTQSLTLDVYFDDSGLLPVALNPSLSLGKRVSGKSGTRYEASIEPVLLESGSLKVTVPVAVGVSSNRYYGDAVKDLSYGYTAAGLAATYKVSKSLSLTGNVLGYNSDAKLNNKNSNFLTSQFGVEFAF